MGGEFVALDDEQSGSYSGPEVGFGKSDQMGNDKWDEQVRRIESERLSP
jgi:hypothetical protein